MKIKNSAVVLVYNDKGELALQLRAAHDDNYPSHWDFSAAGGIHTGEPHHDAAVRELREELGITSPLTFLREDVYQDENMTDTMFTYKTVYNGEFSPEPREVAEVVFYDIEKIREMLTDGTLVHPEFRYMFKKMGL